MLEDLGASGDYFAGWVGGGGAEVLVASPIMSLNIFSIIFTPANMTIAPSMAVKMMILKLFSR
jgi:hypothetical protein